MWDSYFSSEEIEGYVKGEYMDFGVICEIASRFDESSLASSALKGVKEHLLSFLDG